MSHIWTIDDLLRERDELKADRDRWRQIAEAYALEIAQRDDLVAQGFCQGTVFKEAQAFLLSGGD